MGDSFTHSNRVQSKDFLQNCGALMDADFDWNRIVKYYSVIMEKANKVGSQFADAYVPGSGKYVEMVANKTTEEIANALATGKKQSDKLWKQMNWKDRRYTQIRLFRKLYENYFVDKVMQRMGDGSLNEGLENRLIARIILFSQYFCTQDSGIVNPETNKEHTYPEITRIDSDVDVMLFLNQLSESYDHREHGETKEQTFTKWSKLVKKMKAEANGQAKKQADTADKVQNAGISAAAVVALGFFLKGA